MAEIEITLNGLEEKIPETFTIFDLIERFDERDAQLIVERNGRFVYPQQYITSIEAGDAIEFINPNFGG